MHFYLMSKGPRLVITDDVQADCPSHEGWRRLRRTDAPDWLHAKAAFGLPLTDLQSELLPLNEAQRARRIAGDRIFGHL